MLEKSAEAYLRAYIASASVNTSNDSIKSALWLATKVSHASAQSQDIRTQPLHVMDYYYAFRGIPASHAFIVLDELIKNRAPEAMLLAFLRRLCVMPTEKTLPNLCILARHENKGVSLAACIALAFIPSRTAALAEIKRNILIEENSAFAIAAGVDEQLEALPALEKLMSQDSDAETRFYAAWPLGHLLQVDPAAKAVALRHAKESDNHIVRAILLAGLAAFDPHSTTNEIAMQIPTSLEVECLILLIAQSYVTDAENLLSMIASSVEDYPYYQMPTLQLIFSDALQHASLSAPLLAELLRIGDLPT
ncbi:hypothetical protein QEV83_09355 [Methylocapsa sp. D3K7]|uniref:hypothetical protein n=1 Tax=Methylocapsa sp. D3K7 TaxID=3041435 RepID=UPI00244EC1F6|nr:hypothetical protein [Methylocapsa sp. D3K7]WGJ16415.1 hypothetical protein QEV83_09355 [Methylocapsa sp. D3K7]